MSALALTVMLAARPTVAVEVHPDPFVDAAGHARLEQLRGWLVRRLLQEGYDVAADSDAAHGVVRLRAARDGLVVEASGVGHRSYAVESGPEAVQRLEVLHRALQGVEQTCDATAATASSEPGLVLKFLGETEGDDMLEAVAVVALHAGVTLHGGPAPEATLACIEHRGSLAEVSLGPATDECGPPLLVLDLGEGTDAERRSAARRLVDTVRPPVPDPEPLDVDALGGPPAIDLSAVPDAAVVHDDDGLVPMHGPPRAELRLGVSGGVVSRGSNVDALVQMGWRMGKIDGVGGRLSVSLVPSTGAASVEVIDSRMAVGPDWTIRAGKRGHVDFAVLVGTDMHTFKSGDRSAADVALGAELPVTYALTIRGQARLFMGLNPGITSRRWRHETGVFGRATVAWERPAWRVGMTVGITHGWRIE